MGDRVRRPDILKRLRGRWCKATCPGYDKRECVRRDGHGGPHACFSHEWRDASHETVPRVFSANPKEER